MQVNKTLHTSWYAYAAILVVPLICVDPESNIDARTSWCWVTTQGPVLNVDLWEETVEIVLFAGLNGLQCPVMLTLEETREQTYWLRKAGRCLLFI